MRKKGRSPLAMPLCEVWLLGTSGYAVTLTPVVADGAVELEPLVELDAKLGRNCCRSDCNEA